MARPRKKIDTELLAKLAKLGLTTAELAAIMECSKDTLERRYMDVIEQGRLHRNASLKRKQYEAAMAGNPTMLIWLGKQYLEQRDKHDVAQNTDRLDELMDAINKG
jgi:hypothetical protein